MMIRETRLLIRENNFLPSVSPPVKPVGCAGALFLLTGDPAAPIESAPTRPLLCLRRGKISETEGQTG